MTVAEIGRLAMRVEGDNWVAYWTPRQDTMERAVFLGSVSMALVQKEKRKNQFLRLMQEMFGDMVEKTHGQRPRWTDPIEAPEHERSGNA